MNQTCLAALGAALLLFVTFAEVASSQTDYVGIEPNDTKATATVARGLVPGDRIVVRASSCQFLGPDFFRIAPASLPPAIYEHRLTKDPVIALSPDSMDIYGLDAVIDEVLPQSLAILSTSDSVDPSTGTQFISWYGFGKAEEIYVELGNTGACRTGAAGLLSTSTVTPTQLGSIPSISGFPTYTSIEASGSGPAGPVDVEMHLFDHEFNALPTMWNDDKAGALDASIAGFLADGVYYLAVSDAEVASHLPPSSLAGELNFLHSVTDFAGPLLNGSAAVGFDVNVLINGAGHSLVTVPKTIPFEVLWFTFAVGTGQDTGTFCPGDGTVVSCPCGMDAPQGSGVGCPNSTGRGASMVAYTPASFGVPHLTLEDLPSGSSALTFLSLGTQTHTAVFAGFSCLGSGAVRLPITTANAVGSSSFDIATQNLPAVFMGQSVFAQAAYRDSLSPPCNVNLTSGATFILY